MAEGLIGSEILKIAADIRAMISEGKQICNLTVGDFSPAQFPIPDYLEAQIEQALQRGETNYPPADGVLPTLSQQQRPPPRSLLRLPRCRLGTGKPGTRATDFLLGHGHVLQVTVQLLPG